VDEYHVSFAPNMTPSLTPYDNGWMLLLGDDKTTLAVYLTEEQVQELAAVFHGRTN
jgi:hypothetical protein